MPDNMEVSGGTPERIQTVQNPPIPALLTPPQTQAPSPGALPPTTPGGTTQPAAPGAPTARHGIIGRGVEAILGAIHGEYSEPQMDAQGNITESPVKQKPGAIFRHILAGALIGGAAGSEHPEQGFMGGLARGGNASGEANRIEDQRKRQQLQQQFQRNQEAQRMGMEKERLDIEKKSAVSAETLRQAQIQESNTNTVYRNKMIQGLDIKNHQEEAELGKAHLLGWLDAGVPILYQDRSESEMHDIIKKDPAKQALDWEATDWVVKGINKDGSPHYEQTFSAIDPKGPVKLSQRDIDDFKSVQLENRHGANFYNINKVGKEISSEQMMGLRNEYNIARREQQKTKLENLSIKEKEAEINKNNAERAKFILETDLARDNITKSRRLSKAMDHYKVVGGDFSKLDAAERFVIGESPEVTERMKELREEVRASLAADDKEGAKRAAEALQDYDTLSKQAINFKKEEGKIKLTNLKAAIDRASTSNVAKMYKHIQEKPDMSLDDIKELIDAAPISTDEKNEVRGVFGLTSEKPSTGERVGKVVSKGIEKIPAVQAVKKIGEYVSAGGEAALEEAEKAVK